MGFFEYIDSLRRAPLVEKRRFATRVAFFAMVCVGVVWALFTLSRFYGGEEVSERVVPSHIRGPYHEEL